MFDPSGRQDAIKACTVLMVVVQLLVAGCQTQLDFEAADPRSDSQSQIQSRTNPPAMVNPGKFTAGNRTPYEVWDKTYHVLPSSLGYVEIGIASWYGKKFHGRKTSNGETYDMYQLSAAHKALPLPTWVRVTNLDSGKKVVLRVNDRGPFHDDRLIDLSWKTALELGFENKGTAPVVVEALDHRNYPTRANTARLGDQYYLQLGAFSQPTGAKSLQQKIDRLLSHHQLETSTRILQSEVDTLMLHKVWLGPIANEGIRDEIASLVESSDLGKPLRVDIEGESTTPMRDGN